VDYVPPTLLLAFLDDIDTKNLMQVCKLVHDVTHPYYIGSRVWKCNAPGGYEFWKHVRKLRHVHNANPQVPKTLDKLVVDANNCPMSIGEFTAKHFVIKQWLVVPKNRIFDTFPIGVTNVKISAPLIINQFPDGIVKIENNYPYAQICGLPQSLEHLETGFLCDVRNLEKLNHLTISEFTEPLQIGVLGTCLTSLELCKFDHFLDEGVLPTTLIKLAMHNYTEDLLPGVLPCNLRELQLSSYSKSFLVPSNLEHLTVYDLHPSLVLPQCLTSLYVPGCSSPQLILPNSITSLHLPLIPDVLPNKLVEFRLFRYHTGFCLEKWPASLRRFQLLTMATPWADPLVGYWLREFVNKWTLYLNKDWKNGSIH
jgi:hypothetical protein